MDELKDFFIKNNYRETHLDKLNDHEKNVLYDYLINKKELDSEFEKTCNSHFHFIIGMISKFTYNNTPLAIQLLQKSIDKDNNLYATCMYGEVMYDKKNYKLAKEYFEKSLAIEPIYLDRVYYNLCRYYRYVEKDFDMALSFYEKLFPFNINYLSELAVYCKTENKMDLSIKYYRIILEKHESKNHTICELCATCANNIGIIYYNNYQNYDLAKEYYLKAIKFGCSHAPNNMYNVIIKQDNEKIIMKDFEDMINTGCIEAYCLFGNYYISKKDYLYAIYYYTQAAELGMIAAMIQIAYLNELDKNRKETKYYYLMGINYDINKYATSERHKKQLEALNEDHLIMQCYTNLATLYGEYVKKKYDKCKKYCQKVEDMYKEAKKANKLTDNHKQLYAHSLIDLIVIYHDVDKNYDLVIKYLYTSIKLGCPESIELLIKLKHNSNILTALKKSKLIDMPCEKCNKIDKLFKLYCSHRICVTCFWNMCEDNLHCLKCNGKIEFDNCYESFVL